jgi:hypothetical protein
VNEIVPFPTAVSNVPEPTAGSFTLTVAERLAVREVVRRDQALQALRAAVITDIRAAHDLPEGCGVNVDDLESGAASWTQ